MLKDLSLLDNKTILVTGVSGTIGHDIAKKLLVNKKIKIIGIVSGLRKSNLIKDLLLNNNFYLYKMDLNKIKQISRHCNKIKKIYGNPDIIINSAGIFNFKKLTSYSLEDIVSNFNINSLSPIIITKFFINNMVKNKWGRIINICSSSSYNGGDTIGHCIYASSKHALLGFSRALDEEYRSKNIRVGTISPAGILSKMTKNRKDIKKSSLIPVSQMTDAVLYLLLSNGKGIVYELRLWRMQR